MKENNAFHVFRDVEKQGIKAKNKRKNRKKAIEKIKKPKAKPQMIHQKVKSKEDYSQKARLKESGQRQN